MAAVYTGACVFWTIPLIFSLFDKNVEWNTIVDGILWMLFGSLLLSIILGFPLFLLSLLVASLANENGFETRRNALLAGAIIGGLFPNYMVLVLRTDANIYLTGLCIIAGVIAGWVYWQIAHKDGPVAKAPTSTASHGRH